MNPTDPDVWQEHNHRPAWVRRHRDELQDATGFDIPRNLAELQDWLSGYRGHVTRRLREQTEEHSTTADGGDD
jgi:outer membrane biogenesis lipoprotein LolB